MKTYSELTEEQQAAALAYRLEKIADAVTTGELRFDDAKNEDTFQTVVDASVHYATKFVPEDLQRDYILDAQFRFVMDTDGTTDYETVRERLTSMASCEAEDSLYSETSDGPVIDGIA